MKLTGAVLALFVALAGLAAGAVAAPSSEVIKILSVQVSEKHPTETTFVIKDNDFIGGKKAGTDTLTCKVASQSSARCGVVFKLSGGTITGNFTISFTSPTGSGKVTAGTGKYAGVKGTLTFKNLNEKGTRTNVVLTLS